jgi:hypothetical protein
VGHAMSLEEAHFDGALTITILLPLMPALNPVANIQKAPSTARTSGIILLSTIHDSANVDCSRIDTASGGFVAFGEACLFTGDEGGAVVGSLWMAHVVVVVCGWYTKLMRNLCERQLRAVVMLMLSTK